MPVVPIRFDHVLIFFQVLQSVVFKPVVKSVMYSTYIIYFDRQIHSYSYPKDKFDAVRRNPWAVIIHSYSIIQLYSYVSLRSLFLSVFISKISLVQLRRRNPYHVNYTQYQTSS